MVASVVDRKRSVLDRTGEWSTELGRMVVAEQILKVAVAAESDRTGAVADHTEECHSFGKGPAVEVAKHPFRTSGWLRWRDHDEGNGTSDVRGVPASS